MTAQDELIEALKPFADAVFNDNGDVTYNMSVKTDDLWRAYCVYRRARAALASASASPTEEIEGLIAGLGRIIAATDEYATVWGDRSVGLGAYEACYKARKIARKLLRTLSSRATAMPVRGDVYKTALERIRDSGPYATSHDIREYARDVLTSPEPIEGQMTPEIKAWAESTLTAPTHRDDAPVADAERRGPPRPSKLPDHTPYG